jgi:hypothetical protein
MSDACVRACMRSAWLAKTLLPFLLRVKVAASLRKYIKERIYAATVMLDTEDIPKKLRSHCAVARVTSGKQHIRFEFIAFVTTITARELTKSVFSRLQSPRKIPAQAENRCGEAVCE